MIRNLRMGIGRPSLSTLAERRNELLTEDDSPEPQPPLYAPPPLWSAIDPEYPDLVGDDLMEEETAQPEKSSQEGA